MFEECFICKHCANNADAGNLVHSACEQGCDCQHGTPRVKASASH